MLFQADTQAQGIFALDAEERLIIWRLGLQAISKRLEEVIGSSAQIKVVTWPDHADPAGNGNKSRDYSCCDLQRLPLKQSLFNSI